MLGSKIGEIPGPFQAGSITCQDKAATHGTGFWLDTFLKPQSGNFFLLVFYLTSRKEWVRLAGTLLYLQKTTPSSHTFSCVIFSYYSQNSQMAEHTFAFHKPSEQHCWEVLWRQFWFYIANFTPSFFVTPFTTGTLIPLPQVFTAFSSLEPSQITERATSRGTNRTPLR